MHNNTININVESVICVGDTHAHFKDMRQFIESHNIRNAVIVLCGDNGLGFDQRNGILDILSELNKYCQSIDVHLILIRGNHDNPSWYLNGKIWESNVKCIQDYTVITTLKHNILCVGGAVSIDRALRRFNYGKSIRKYMDENCCDEKDAASHVQQTYWDDEMPCFHSGALDAINVKIDIVCSHTCPSFCEPKEKQGTDFWVAYDEQLHTDLIKERKTMDAIYQRLMQDSHPINYWCYGHFHYHHSAQYNATKFILLDKYREDKLYDWFVIP